MKKIFRFLVLKFIVFLFYLMRLFPIKNNKIVFSNFGGKGFGDNPKYISIKIQELYKNKYSLYWLCDDLNEKFPNYIKVIKRESLKGIYHLVTAKVWVDNSRKPFYVRKRKKQIYIQTWHGSISLKRIENDCLIPLPKEWIKASKNDSKMIDYIISNSKWATNIYQQSFWYKGKVIECGSPRLDSLILNTRNDNFSNTYNVSKNDFVILYAPTFRSGTIDCFDLDVDKIIDKFEQREKRNVLFFLRMHPINSKGKYKILLNKNIINVTDYPDVYEILPYVNVLLTDYSSLMFEVMLVNKEVHLYAKDANNYSHERGKYFEFSELPFSFSTSNDELLKNIELFNTQDLNKYNVFIDKLGINEKGNASCEISKLIDSLVK